MVVVGEGCRAGSLAAAGLLAVFGLLVVGCPLSEYGGAEQPLLRLVGDCDVPRTVVFGPIAGQEPAESVQRAIQVWTGDMVFDENCQSPTSQPAVLGTVASTEFGFEYRPRFPFAPGMTYTACAMSEASKAGVNAGRAVVLSFRIPRCEHQGSVPSITTVWPQTQSVPENLLRLYVHFSEPMTQKAVLSHVSLLRRDGSEIVDAFVDIPNGLWDRDSKRLTLFLHPGRIKRGVGPHEKMGTVLTAGDGYLLRIDGAVQSQGGVPLGEAFHRKIEVGPADRISPDPSEWALVAPDSPNGTVSIDFGESLDRGLLARFADVFDALGMPIEGVATASTAGDTWSFQPDRPWRPGNYRVRTRGPIEDLAGNTPQSLFDVSTSQPIDDEVSRNEDQPANGYEFPFSVG